MLLRQHARKGGPQPLLVVTPEALQPLAGFLRATGWKLVFGVNLKIGVPAMAVELARAVQRIVGDDLLAIQIGNEANNYDAMQLALINKDAARDASIAVSGLQSYGSGRLMRLSAPSLDSRDGLVLEGGQDAVGYPVSVDAHGICRIAVPRGSAAWVRLNRSV